jgi:PST family polysaccharide transporter
VKAKTSAYLFINVLKVIALLYHASLYVFAVLTVLEVLTASAILLLFYTKLSKNDFPKWKLDPIIIKSLLLRSWPFLIAELLIIFYTRLDQIMIKNMIGNEELGRYSAAVRLSEIWYFIPGAISVSLYPTLVKLKAESEEALTMGFQKLFNILTAISLLLAICATFLSEYVAMFLYGEEFKGVGTILSIHIWTGIAVFLGTGSGYWLVLHGLQKYSLIQTISGAVVNIVLNFLLIPRYLGVGAAIATLVAQITATIISNALMSKTRPVFWLQLKALLNVFRPSIKNYI